MKSLVIFPTYNEAENIGDIVARVREVVPEAQILVVDDNSPDGTARIVENLQRSDEKVNLMVRPGKQGLAGAYLAGFQWGLARGFDAIVEMDADFSHRPEDLPRLLDALKTNDVAVGCRYMRGGGTVGWSWLRQGISRGGNLYAQGILRLPYLDLTGGFNAWRRAVLETIDLASIHSRGYAFQVEMKYRAHRKGFRIAEIPILFENRRRGISKMTGKIVWEAAYRVLQMRGQAPA